MLCDSAQDPWAEFVVLVKRKDEVLPISARQCAV
jgi:hypothetical protein